MSSARALVCGHADFAAGLLSAIAQIAGRDDLFVSMTNRDLSADGVLETMRARVSGDVAVIFTDLPAGSCTTAARRLQRERPELMLVTGTNLATLLDFAFSGDLPPAEAARHAADKGRAALAVSVPGAPRAH